jgi:hypothetical protein
MGLFYQRDTRFFPTCGLIRARQADVTLSADFQKPAHSFFIQEAVK